MEDMFEEMRLSRALACVIHDQLTSGVVLPKEVVEAYEKLNALYQWQINKELS